MTHKPRYNLYIAACDEQGGIYRFVLTDDGRLEPKETAKCDRPMYLATENETMYCLLRTPFAQNDESGLTIYKIGEDGTLMLQEGLRSTCGKCACHLCVKDGEVYAVNYLSSNIIKMPDTVVTHSGKGVCEKRQDMAHPHMVSVAPDGNIIAVDLGIDSLVVYDADLNYVSSAKVPDGHGARHIVFSKDGTLVYCVNELQSTVSVFEYADAKLTLLDTYESLPKGMSKEGNTAAAIRISDDGRYLYISHRGRDLVSCFAVDGKKLVLCSNTPCGGERPRDFDLVGKYLVCANEGDNSVTVLEVNGDTLTLTDKAQNVPGALCVVWKEMK